MSRRPLCGTTVKLNLPASRLHPLLRPEGNLSNDPDLSIVTRSFSVSVKDEMNLNLLNSVVWSLEPQTDRTGTWNQSIAPVQALDAVPVDLTRWFCRAVRTEPSLLHRSKTVCQAATRQHSEVAPQRFAGPLIPARRQMSGSLTGQTFAESWQS